MWYRGSAQQGSVWLCDCVSVCLGPDNLRWLHLSRVLASLRVHSHLSLLSAIFFPLITSRPLHSSFLPVFLFIFFSLFLSNLYLSWCPADLLRGVSFHYSSIQYSSCWWLPQPTKKKKQVHFQNCRWFIMLYVYTISAVYKWVESTQGVVLWGQRRHCLSPCQFSLVSFWELSTHLPWLIWRFTWN